MRARANGSKPKGKVTVRREVSAGGLIWRRREGKVEVVLVRPASKQTWVLPKGHLEPGEGAIEAAAREATEESGLEVVAGDPLGEVSYVYSWRDGPDDSSVRIFKRVHFYLMKCTGGDPSAHDGEIDEVAWLGIDDAIGRATHKSERDLIVKARTILPLP
jgi:8-oxo-dGTP pyrophosphatase MutT (NUDIX family)